MVSDADSAARAAALRRLGLTDATPICIIAGSDADLSFARATSEAVDKAGDRRVGVGPVLPARDARVSYQQAQLALRLTAEGTADDPGRRVILAHDAGVLLTLVQNTSHSDPQPSDVAALESAATSWMLETLEAVSTTDSVRDAAALLHLHHSTLQERASRAERLLGWKVLGQHGRQRTQLALVMRRILRPAPEPSDRGADGAVQARQQLAPGLVPHRP